MEAMIPDTTKPQVEEIFNLESGGVRHQGLEPRTRWLRDRFFMCRVVSSDAGQDLFGWSSAIACVGLYRVLSSCARPLGLFSGSHVPDSAELSVQVDRAACGCGCGLPGRAVDRVEQAVHFEHAAADARAAAGVEDPRARGQAEPFRERSASSLG
ncbi:hypothetical protein [Amycolatopsis sp. NPDC051371]|uniref:hypothetical protein n=1 Tax=Amycolatopsis sp. NPDC051371 TaxID=3155800 RepID=UPI003441EC21